MINIKAKIGLKSNIIVWDIDFCCFKGRYLFHNIFVKVQTQDLTVKKSKPKELKPKKLKLANEKFFALPHINFNKSIKLFY